MRELAGCAALRISAANSSKSLSWSSPAGLRCILGRAANSVCQQPNDPEACALCVPTFQLRARRRGENVARASSDSCSLSSNVMCQLRGLNASYGGGTRMAWDVRWVLGLCRMPLLRSVRPVLHRTSPTSVAPDLSAYGGPIARHPNCLRQRGRNVRARRRRAHRPRDPGGARGGPRRLCLAPAARVCMCVCVCGGGGGGGGGSGMGAWLGPRARGRATADRSTSSCVP